jgi:hypothetical protein
MTMALVIIGRSACNICGELIKSGQNYIGFPPFVSNEKDPLHCFSDAAVHEECLAKHSLASEVRLRREEALKASAPHNRCCSICGKAFETPDDYLALGHLVVDRAHPLFQYNYAQFHRSCLKAWPNRENFKQLLIELNASGAWGGPALTWIIKQVT